MSFTNLVKAICLIFRVGFRFLVFFTCLNGNKYDVLKNTNKSNQCDCVFVFSLTFNLTNCQQITDTKGNQMVLTDWRL